MSILVTRPSPAGEELVSRLRTLGQVARHFPLIEFLRVDNYRNLLINWQRWRERSVVCPLATRGCFCPITAASARS